MESESDLGMLFVLFSLGKDTPLPDLDEQIDYLSSVIAKQDVSDVRQSGSRFRPFQSIHLCHLFQTDRRVIRRLLFFRRLFRVTESARAEECVSLEYSKSSDAQSLHHDPANLQTPCGSDEGSGPYQTRQPDLSRRRPDRSYVSASASRSWILTTVSHGIRGSKALSYTLFIDPG